MKDTYRYDILAYEDARQKRPIKHEYGGTTVLTEGTVALWVGLHPHRVPREQRVDG